MRDVTEVEQKALDYCLELTSSKFGFIGLLNEARDAMVVAAIKGFVPNAPDFYEKYRFMSVRPSVFGITLVEERPYISNDVSHDPLSVGQPPGHPPVETFLGVPLRVASTLIGLIGVANKPEGYDGDDERLLSTFANQVAVALDNARLYQQQRKMIQQLISLVELATEVSSSRPVQHRDDDRAGEGGLGPFSFGPAQTPEPVTRTLSDTQREILSLVAGGLSNREIAARVHLSEHTVKSHLQEIFRKLSVRNRAEAVSKAARDGLI